MILEVHYNRGTHEAFVTHAPTDPAVLYAQLRAQQHPNVNFQRAFNRHPAFEQMVVNLPESTPWRCTEEFVPYELFTAILEHLPYEMTRELSVQPTPVWYCLDYVQ